MVNYLAYTIAPKNSMLDSWFIVGDKYIEEQPPIRKGRSCSRVKEKAPRPLIYTDTAHNQEPIKPYSYSYIYFNKNKQLDNYLNQDAYYNHQSFLEYSLEFIDRSIPLLTNEMVVDDKSRESRVVVSVPYYAEDIQKKYTENEFSESISNSSPLSIIDPKGDRLFALPFGANYLVKQDLDSEEPNEVLLKGVAKITFKSGSDVSRHRNHIKYILVDSCQLDLYSRFDESGAFSGDVDYSIYSFNASSHHCFNKLINYFNENSLAVETMFIKQFEFNQLSLAFILHCTHEYLALFNELTDSERILLDLKYYHNNSFFFRCRTDASGDNECNYNQWNYEDKKGNYSIYIGY